jgi:hypothetical protein
LQRRPERSPEGIEHFETGFKGTRHGDGSTVSIMERIGATSYWRAARLRIA